MTTFHALIDVLHMQLNGYLLWRVRVVATYWMLSNWHLVCRILIPFSSYYLQSKNSMSAVLVPFSGNLGMRLNH